MAHRRARAVGTRRRPGFTLIELLIVITIIAIVAAIAVPNILSARMNANETAAISVLRTVSTAQAQFVRSGKADEDNDAQGEYGTFGELSGNKGVRGGTAKMPTDLTQSVATVSAFGEVNRSGYWFRMYLPEAGGIGRREDSGGGIGPGFLDPEISEQQWCCYAFPANHGVSGTRTFFINQQGEITFTDRSSYTGANSAILQAGAATRTTNLASMTGLVAVGTRGADTQFWKTVQ